MKPYQAILVILAMYVFAAWLDSAEATEIECFTDSCVGCIDCLQPLNEG